MRHPLMKNNITRADLEPVIERLKEVDPQLTQNKSVREFENRWSDWLGVKHSVFVNSGASANYITFEILRHQVGSGEIILSPVNWISDIAAVIRSGFTPVFADIRLETLSVDPDKILDLITPNTKAILITHIQGFNAMDDKVIEVCLKKGIRIIEDACESHGAKHKDKLCGSFGHMSNFSFYYAHHLSTIEGGMICTNDEETYEMARMYRSHGMVREMDNELMKKSFEAQYADLDPKFIFKYPGYNMRNTEIGALIGLSQLGRLNDNVHFRSTNFNYFLSKLNNEKFFTSFSIDGLSNYALVLMIRNGNSLKAKAVEKLLSNNNIEFRRGGACGGNHLRQPYLREYLGEGHPGLSDFPNADYAHFFAYYLGNYPGLSQGEIDWLCGIINSVEF